MLPYAERVSRSEDMPTEEAAERLVQAGNRRKKADATARAALVELKAAVIEAAAAGGSNRVIARLGQVSTKTARDWVDESKQPS